MTATSETIWDLHPIECALIDLETWQSDHGWDRWTKGEMKALKAAAESVDFGLDLYDAMKAKNNHWGYRAGRADINQIESWMRQWDQYKGLSDN